MKQLPELVKDWIEDPNRTHWDGLAILSQLTNNRMMIRNLSRKDSKYNREKLFNELTKLSKSLPPTTTQIQIDDDDSGESNGLPSDQSQPADDSQENNDNPPADHPGGNVDYEHLISQLPENNLPRFQAPAPPPILNVNPDDAKSAEDLEISLGKMFNLIGMLSNSLRDFKEEDNDGRKKVLDRIADIKKSREGIQSKLDHFKQHGLLPALTDPPPQADTKIANPIPDDPILLGKRLLNERSNLSKLKRKISNGSSKPEQLAAMEQALLEKSELVNELQRRLNGSGS